MRGALTCMVSATTLSALAAAASAPASAQGVLPEPLPATAAQSRNAWKTYTFANDGFAVDLPAAPEVLADRPSGQILSSRQYQLEMGVGSFVVSATHYASDAKLDQWDDRSMVELANAMKGNCRIRDGRPGSFGGALSYEMVLDQCPDGAAMKVRMYVIGEWVYQAVAAGPPGVDAKPDTQRFHDSFRLVQLDRPRTADEDQYAFKPKKSSAKETRSRREETRSRRSERRAAHRSSSKKSGHARSSRGRRR